MRQISISVVFYDMYWDTEDLDSFQSPGNPTGKLKQK